MVAAVNDRSAEVEAMAVDWPITDALMAGTRAMRKLDEAALPKWPNEEPDSYAKRRDTATLFPAFRRTVSVMGGKPFSKALTLSEDTPAEIVAWADNIDREGVNLHTFAAEMLLEALSAGICGVLVEAPKPVPPSGAVVTRADEKAAGIRPYFVRVMHKQILGWRAEMRNGARVLTQLRLLECVTRPAGEFGEAKVDRVRVLEPGSWRVFEEAEKAGPDGKKEWVEVESGQSGLPAIPFVPLYGWRKDFMCGVSPLLDLAFLNVKHWQSQSDQDTILHVARVPILAIIGGDDKSQLTVGASSAVKLPTGADMKFVEHSGAAIDAGAKSLADLEQQMIQAGAELLVKKPGDRSATEASNDAEANKSDLQRIVEGFEDSIDQALQFMADYAKLGSGGNATLYKDFGAAALSDASAQLIATLMDKQKLSTKTGLTELKRRGTLSGDIDVEEEAEAAAIEYGPLQPEEPIDPVTGQPIKQDDALVA